MALYWHFNLSMVFILTGNVCDSLLQGIDSVDGMTTEGSGVSFESINVSRKAVLDVVEMSLGSINQITAVLLNFVTQTLDSLHSKNSLRENS